MVEKCICITIVCILVAALGAPQVPPITEPPQSTTELPAGAIKPNATVVLSAGTDGRWRNITGTVRNIVYNTILFYNFHILFSIRIAMHKQRVYTIFYVRKWNDSSSQKRFGLPWT